MDFEGKLWILLIQLRHVINASSAAASLQRMRLASTKNFITAALPRIFALTAAANILRFPSHFFKRKLKNLRQWDARCFFEPPVSHRDRYGGSISVPSGSYLLSIHSCMKYNIIASIRRFPSSVNPCGSLANCSNFAFGYCFTAFTLYSIGTISSCIP